MNRTKSLRLAIGAIGVLIGAAVALAAVSTPRATAPEECCRCCCCCAECCEAGACPACECCGESCDAACAQACAAD